MITEGGKSFGARKNRMIPQALPYYQDPNDTKTIYPGSPVALSSGNTVRRATVSGSLITETKLLGFAAGSAVGDSALTQEFAQMPQIKDRNNRRQILVYVADGLTTFTMAAKSGVTGSEALVGASACNLREEDTDSFSLDTASTANGLVQVTAFHPSDLGKNAPRLDFIVPAAKSSFLAP